MSRWTPDDMGVLTGRTVVITGASSGIGLAAARVFATKGAHVVAAVRDTAKGNAALGDAADVRRLDVADLSSVSQFAESLTGDIDILVNNAGVMAVPLQRTRDGHELQIATNHLGHFALTGHLLERVTDRVVTVSSTAHRMGKIRLSDLNWHDGYSRWGAYGQSKLANLLFTSELQRRLGAAGSRVRAVAVHPGYANTALQGRTESRVQDGFMGWANRYVAQSAEQGAWPTLFAATEDIEGDSFVGPDGFAEVRGHPAPASRSRRARDAATAAALWHLSEELTGVRYLS